MSVTFVPAILTDTETELLLQANRLATLVSEIHIDFADNTLVPNQTILPDAIEILPTQVSLHAHLMAAEPTAYFQRLATLGFSTVAVHIESATSMEEIIAAADDHGLALALVVNPETNFERIIPYKSHAKYIQLMGVHPGFGGQQFIEDTYTRIKELRAKLPEAVIAVDGGVRLHNAAQLVAAGANLLIVGHGGYTAPNEDVERWQELVASM
jgi:ribulose-phosphate 3-epimerase